jgi:hypothetical protein
VPEPADVVSVELRPVEEVRAYLLDQINLSLRRLGMYGGEMALIVLFDALAHVERRDEQWQSERATLRSRRAFTSIGVAGAFGDVLPKAVRHDDAVASVYAEIASRFGWLRHDRILTATEMGTLTEQVADWVAVDRSLTELLNTWGAPSASLGGSNKSYPRTLVYASGGREAPLVCFHLWNWIEATPEAPTAGLFPEPVVLAVRHGDGQFPDTLTFTPEGLRRRPSSFTDEQDRGEVI